MTDHRGHEVREIRTVYCVTCDKELSEDSHDVSEGRDE